MQSREPGPLTLRLPPPRKGVAADAALLARRSGLAGLEAIQIVAPDVSVGDRVIAGVRCVEIIPVETRGVMLHCHGGGFRMGEPRVWAGLASRIAAASGLRIVLPDYRLAPEYPFPAALHDLRAVHDALREEFPDAPLMIGGDSAGGGLACSLTLLLMEDRAASPNGLVLLSPWLDLRLLSETYESRRAADIAFSREAAAEGAGQYLQGWPADSPLVSPLLADLAGFPPVFVAVGGAEVLLGDTQAFVAKLADALVPTDLRFEPAMPHVWPVILPAAPQTAALIDASALFMRRWTDTPV